MLFILLLIITTLAIAGAAAFISVYGLSQIYSGSIFYVTIFAFGALEAGKLVAASALYRFWGTMSKTLRAYMFAAVLVLIGITSAGIFGFLTAAYQVDNIDLRQQEQTIQLYEDQKIRYQERLERIDIQISEVPEAYVTKRMELIETFEPEKQNILNNIAQLDEDILELKTNVLTTEAKIGPILYVSEALSLDSDKALIWFTLIIILVFDPLAVSLTLMANIALAQRSAKKEEREIKAETEEHEFHERELEIKSHDSEALDKIVDKVDEIKKNQETSDLRNRIGKVIDS
jgi:hypothetical protein